MLLCPSPSLPAIYTLAQPLTGEKIHCQWKRWSGTDGIRMIETTYNSFHNFPIFFPFSHLLTTSLPAALSLCFCPTLTIVWMHDLRPFQCRPVLQLSPKGPRLSGSPTTLTRQPIGERQEGGTLLVFSFFPHPCLREILASYQLQCFQLMTQGTFI